MSETKSSTDTQRIDYKHMTFMLSAYAAIGYVLYRFWFQAGHDLFRLYRYLFGG